ncbi:MAG: Hpt domain-containing protein [Sulfurovaceae bacterium]|nr:Hpt domain-containing protein [Sulfurovaceae bacterium]
MNNSDGLPNFKHINKNIGLKFLNLNTKLYLKILNSFLDRYENLKTDSLDINEIKDIVHTIKGLSATLGMEKLNKVAMSELNEQQIEELWEELFLVISELKKELRST